MGEPTLANRRSNTFEIRVLLARVMRFHVVRYLTPYTSARWAIRTTRSVLVASSRENSTR